MVALQVLAQREDFFNCLGAILHLLQVYCCKLSTVYYDMAESVVNIDKAVLPTSFAVKIIRAKTEKQVRRRRCPILV